MIREATHEDTPRLVEMGLNFIAGTPYRDLVAGDPGHISATVARVGANPDGAWLLCEEGGEVVGMIGMLVYDHPFSGERTAFEIVWWVEPRARSGGAGMRLLRAAETWARTRGAKAMQMVAPNARVGALYERLGYQPIEMSFQRSL